MSRPRPRPLDRTGSHASADSSSSSSSSTSSSTQPTGLEGCTMAELSERLGLHCANFYSNPLAYTDAELAAFEAPIRALTELRRKVPSTRIFIQAARWNRWTDPQGVVHRFAAGGPGLPGATPAERQETSLGLPRNEAEYLRLLEAKRLAQVTPPAAVVVPPSPMKAPLPTYPPDSSLTTLATSQQLPTSTDTRGRSPPASTSRSSTSSSSDASRTSARTAHKRRTSLSPVTAMKTIVPEWQDPPPSDLPAAVEAPKPPSAGSSGASSTQSGLTFPVVKAKLKDKPLDHSVPAGGKQTAQGGKRKSRKSPIPPAADSRKGKGRATTSTTAPPMPVAFEEEPPWDEDDSIEIAAGKGPTARQKMRVNPRGWEGIEDISACAEYLPLSFPSDLATSTPLANKKRPPPILRPITAYAPAPSAAVDGRPEPAASLGGGRDADSCRPPIRSTRAALRRRAATSKVGSPAATRPLPMTSTAPGTPTSESPSSPSLPTPPRRERRQYLLSRSSMLGATSSDSQLGDGSGSRGPASSLAKQSADGSLPFSLGFSQVDRAVDDVRAFLDADAEGIADDWE